MRRQHLWYYLHRAHSSCTKRPAKRVGMARGASGGEDDFVEDGVGNEDAVDEQKDRDNEGVVGGAGDDDGDNDDSNARDRRA